MCGIAGAIGRIGPGVREAVRAASERQRLRGPDSSGEWSSGGEAETAAGAFLAFRRLKIIDLSALSDQPMVDRATGNAMVFNGEIYNFRELREELATLGHTFASSGDSEVLLKSYAQWGEGCLTRLRGMFALAIWDPKRRTALVARDRLGIKPLFYATVDGPGGKTVLFASQVRSLLASGMIAPRLDPRGVSTFLWSGFVTGPGTIVRGVHMLPGGCSLTVNADDGSATQKRYWRLPRDGEQRPGSEDLRRTLETAVKQHLVSDVPLGVFLSGGRDSSALAAVAQRISPVPVRTFTIAFQEARYDESTYARRVAELLGTEHHEVPLTEEGIRSGLDGALASIDQPTFDAINSYFVSRAVRDAGLTVAMAGTGGDELFGGYRTFAELPRLAAWTRRLGAVPNWAKRPAAIAVARCKARAFGSVPPQTRWGKLADALEARGDLLHLYQIAYAMFTRDIRGRLGNGLCIGEPYGLLASREAELGEIIKGRTDLSAIAALEIELFLGERLLRDTDAASMEVSLEVRVPLLDHEVVEAVCAQSDERRFLPSMSKSLLHDVAMPELPRELFNRPKAGFELPMEVWCRRGLKDRIEATMADGDACRSVGLEPKTVAELWAAFQANPRAMYWSRVWAMFVLMWWCREHGVAL